MQLFGWRKAAYCIAFGEILTIWLLTFINKCPKGVLFFLIGRPDQEEALV